MTSPGGTKTYGYDAARRMTWLQYSLGTAAWAWLDNHRLSKQTLPNDRPLRATIRPPHSTVSGAVPA